MNDQLTKSMTDIFFSDFRTKLRHYDVYIQFGYRDDFYKKDTFNIKHRFAARNDRGFGFITYQNDVHELTWSVNKNTLNASLIDLIEQYTPFISEYMEWQRNNT